jgi:hypothetical protein
MSRANYVSKKYNNNAHPNNISTRTSVPVACSTRTSVPVACSTWTSVPVACSTRTSVPVAPDTVEIHTIRGLITKQKIFNHDNIKSESLDPRDCTLHDLTVHHIGKNLIRIIPITTQDHKNYYFMTDSMEPNSLSCAIPKNGYRTINFILRKKQQINKQDTEVNIGIHQTIDPANDPANPSNIQVDTLIDRFNVFLKGLTDRVKFLMMIPQYQDKTVYYPKVNTIRIEGSTKLKNIIEYLGKKTNFHHRDVNRILLHCRCKFLFHIMSISITVNNVHLNTKIVRIYPENFDTLNLHDRVHTMNEINRVTIKNNALFNDLDNITEKRTASKRSVRDELKQLVSL